MIAVPFVFNFVTKGSAPMVDGEPPIDDCTALIVGKSTEVVSPVTYAAPAASTAMATPTSAPEPPRYVEKSRPDPSFFILTMYASCTPLSEGWTGLFTGKSF